MKTVGRSKPKDPFSRKLLDKVANGESLTHHGHGSRGASCSRQPARIPQLLDGAGRGIKRNTQGRSLGIKIKD